MYKWIYISVIMLWLFSNAGAQSIKLQQGIIFKQGTNIPLGSIDVVNKRTNALRRTSIYGVFNIMAAPGDTLGFSGLGYNNVRIVVNNFEDKVIFLQPVIQLNEVVIRENSFKKDLLDAQDGYRKKSVFYTGTPHYYYLFLKPMTFIYENFKSEVKEARKFKKFANNSLNSLEITKRWNNENIKANTPITDNELDEFRNDYWPSLAQIRRWSDYDLISYIKASYQDFKAKGPRIQLQNTLSNTKSGI